MQINYYYYDYHLGIANGGVPGRGFSNSGLCCVFFAWKSVIAREFLLHIDTSLAIATSGLRTNLLFDKKNLPKTPHSILPRTTPLLCICNVDCQFGGARCGFRSLTMRGERSWVILLGPK